MGYEYLWQGSVRVINFSNRHIVRLKSLFFLIIYITCKTEVPVTASSSMLPENVEGNTGGFSFVSETITDTVVVPVFISEIDKSVAITSKVISELSSKFTLDCKLIAPI